MKIYQLNGTRLLSAASLNGRLSVVDDPWDEEGIAEIVAAMINADPPPPAMIAPPTLTPSPATVGQPVAINLGEWTGATPVGVLRLNATVVAFADGSYTPTGTGTLTLTVTAAPLASISVSATVQASATAPAAFTAEQWSLTTGLGANELVLNITGLPGNGGSAITALEYRVGSGSWVALTGTGTGARTLTMAAAGTSYSINLRAVNAVGAGPASTPKTATSGEATVDPGEPDVVRVQTGTYTGTGVRIDVPLDFEPDLVFVWTDGQPTAWKADLPWHGRSQRLDAGDSTYHLARYMGERFEKFRGNGFGALPTYSVSGTTYKFAAIRYNGSPNAAHTSIIGNATAGRDLIYTDNAGDGL